MTFKGISQTILGSVEPSLSHFSEERLPSYGNPPLVETVLSVQFEPLAKVTAAHLGAFWYARREEWPEVRTQPPIESSFEAFDESWSPQRLQLRLTQQPEIRVQMVGRDRMIQLQRDLLAYNWRRQSESYPRFENLFLPFKQLFSDFSTFMSSHNLGDIRARQWEVVYINHIVKGELWERPDQWSSVLPDLLRDSPTLPEGAALQGLQSQWVFDLPHKQGRLFIEAVPRRTTDKPAQDVLVLRLTARGPINQPSEVDDGINLGHRLIVQSFDHLVSPTAKSHWQRHDDSRPTST